LIRLTSSTTLSHLTLVYNLICLITWSSDQAFNSSNKCKR